MSGEISGEHLQTMISVGIIILGYVWIENRLKKIVAEAFATHSVEDDLRHQMIDQKIEVLQKEVRQIHKQMPKRSSDLNLDGSE